MPVLSIIVTSYNIEKYIAQCLDSVIAQTVEDTEIIVVDDGSKDRTPEIIREYAAKDARIRAVLLEQNTIGGVATPANTGLDLATGTYVGFADGDDYCEPHMFEALLEAAQAGDHDLSMCKYKLLDESNGEFSDPADVKRWSELTEPSYELNVENTKTFLRFIAVPWRKLYKRSFLEENQIRFPVGDYFYEDNPFHWASLTAANSIAIVPEVLCYHRVARAGQTMSTADERLFKIFMHHDTIRAAIKKNDVETVYRPTLIAWAMSQMEWISQRTPKDLRAKLFEVLRGIYSQYTAADIQAALKEGKKGRLATHLSNALIKNSFARFNQYLDGYTETNSPLVAGYYHLRYSNPSTTARLAYGFLRQKIGARKQATTAMPGTHSKPVSIKVKPTDVRNDDLLLALTVLQKQIRRLESRLDEELKRRP